MKNLDQNFIEWACSLSGCNGGDPKADIWISGIEYGMGEDSENYYSSLSKEISKGKCSKPKTYNLNEVVKYRYDQNAIKLYCAIKNIKTGYKEVAKNSNGSEIFKLNLYPIAFKSTDPKLWTKYNLDKITGFKEKQMFKTWCFFHRFPNFAEMVKKYSPKLVIGTGVSYLTDFFAFYAGNNNINSIIETGVIKNKNGSNFRYYWSKINEGKTTLFVVPFLLGQSGLSSNYLIEKMGQTISQHINPEQTPFE